MAGDPSCENFQIYLWNATTKTQLTNFTFKTVLLQRIGKTGKQVEQVATLVVEDQDGDKYELMLAGFGRNRHECRFVSFRVEPGALNRHIDHIPLVRVMQDIFLSFAVQPEADGVSLHVRRVDLGIPP